MLYDNKNITMQNNESDTYIDEMCKYIPKEICNKMWSDENCKQNGKIYIDEKKVKEYIRGETVPGYDDTIMTHVDDGNAEENMSAYIPIIIPLNIMTPIELQKWIYIYIKLVKYYKPCFFKRSLPDEQCNLYSNYYLRTRNPRSIYELIGHIYNHKNHLIRYNKTNVCKAEHIKRKRGYSFHELEITTFSKITYELSKLLDMSISY